MDVFCRRTGADDSFARDAACYEGQFTARGMFLTNLPPSNWLMSHGNDATRGPLDELCCWNMVTEKWPWTSLGELESVLLSLAIVCKSAILAFGKMEDPLQEDD